MITDDLAPLFGASGAGVTIRQGQIVEWTTGTGENQVNLGGVIVENMPLLIAESTVLQPGDMVLVLANDDAAFLLGKVTEPGEPNTVPTWSADIVELNTVTVPAVAATAAAAQDEAVAAAATATQAATDALAAAAAAAAAAADAAAALAKFPITETDIQPGSITTPLLAANAIDGLVITGNEIRTAASGRRIALNDPSYLNRILLASGNENEIHPALIQPIDSGANYGLLELRSPELTAGMGGYAWINLEGYDTGHTGMDLQAASIDIFADDLVMLADSIQLYDGSDGFVFAGRSITADGDATITAPNLDVIGTLKQNGVAVMPGNTPVATLTGAQTLTNKDLTSSTNTFLGRMLTQNLAAVASGNLDLTTTETDVAGATVTFNTTRPNARYLCIGSFYFSAVTASSAIASGKLSVDGAVQPASANFTGASTVPDRNNNAQTWTGTLASTGSHTLKLRGVLSSGTGMRINSGSTSITVLVFE